MIDKNLEVFGKQDLQCYDKKDLKFYAMSYLKTKLDHISKEQQEEFLSLCVLHNLNPLKREIHATIFGKKLQVVVGWEVYNKRALASGLMDGGIEIEYDKSDKGNPIATATVYRKGCKYPFKCSVAFKEYVQRNKEGKITNFWQTKPRTMLDKVVKSQLLRLAFGDVIDGLPFVEEEMPYRENSYEKEVQFDEKTYAKEMKKEKDISNRLIIDKENDLVMKKYESYKLNLKNLK